MFDSGFMRRHDPREVHVFIRTGNQPQMLSRFVYQPLADGGCRAAIPERVPPRTARLHHGIRHIDGSLNRVREDGDEC